jgi:hypothetical protein
MNRRILEEPPSQPVRPSVDSVAAIEDPVERAVAADRAMADLMIVQRALGKIRQAAVYEAVSETERVTPEELADRLGTSASRVRQLNKAVRDELGIRLPNKSAEAQRTLTRDFCWRQYVELGKSLAQIALENDFTAVTVARYMRMHAIPVRSAGGRPRARHAPMGARRQAAGRTPSH